MCPQPNVTKIHNKISILSSEKVAVPNFIMLRYQWPKKLYRGKLPGPFLSGAAKKKI
jgi:hypothetical protein